MSNSHHSQIAPIPDPKITAQNQLRDLARTLATAHKHPALAVFDREVETGEVLSYVVLIEDAEPEELAVGELINPET